jgi:hypothetical protein
MDTIVEAQRRIDQCRAAQTTTLDLSQLGLTHIPGEVFTLTRLQNLTELDLRNNQLSTLPDALTRLEKLNYLEVADNPLFNPLLEVATPGGAAIHTYFANSGEIDHLYEAKLLLVGEGKGLPLLRNQNPPRFDDKPFG